MTVIVYGDFNCPYSYVASQRADLLSRMGTAVDWRAVEHDRGLAVTGGNPDQHRAAWDRELTEVASLALPGEHVPGAPPRLVSNTKAAVTAYAEAVSDGVADKLRRRLFQAIWVRGLHLSSAREVGRIAAEVMWPPEDITGRLASPDLPSLLLREPDPDLIVRRSGGTIAPDGGPLTTAGWRRIQRWRQEWLALPSQVIPVVIGPDHVARSGAGALRYLADLAGTRGAGTRGAGAGGVAPRGVRPPAPAPTPTPASANARQRQRQRTPTLALAHAETTWGTATRSRVAVRRGRQPG
jgi:2-hydroxychromene-2-carboxylate isomerase